MFPVFRHLNIMVKEFNCYLHFKCNSRLFCNHGSPCVFISLINQKFISQGVVLNSPEVMQLLMNYPCDIAAKTCQFLWVYF